MLDLQEMARESEQTAREHGFDDDAVAIKRRLRDFPVELAAFERYLKLAKLMLVTTELAEAAEAVRNGDHSNYGEELADVVIRVGHESFRNGLDLSVVVAEKQAVNKARPIRHGKLI